MQGGGAALSFALFWHRGAVAPDERFSADSFQAAYTPAAGPGRQHTLGQVVAGATVDAAATGILFPLLLGQA